MTGKNEVISVEINDRTIQKPEVLKFLVLGLRIPSFSIDKKNICGKDGKTVGSCMVPPPGVSNWDFGVAPLTLGFESKNSEGSTSPGYSQTYEVPAEAIKNMQKIVRRAVRNLEIPGEKPLNRLRRKIVGW